MLRMLEMLENDISQLIAAVELYEYAMWKPDTPRPEHRTDGDSGLGNKSYPSAWMVSFTKVPATRLVTNSAPLQTEALTSGSETFCPPKGEK